MKTLFTTAVALAFLCVGCMNVGPTRFPQATANFAPKRVYALAYTSAATKVEKTLDDTRIPIASQSKSDAAVRIQTEYVEGESSLIAGGLIAAQSTRYRYSITVKPEGEKTNIGVVCRVESTMKGTAGASQWTDVSSQNAKLVAQLETWLYERIEQNL